MRKRIVAASIATSVALLSVLKLAAPVSAAGVPWHYYYWRISSPEFILVFDKTASRVLPTVMADFNFKTDLNMQTGYFASGATMINLMFRRNPDMATYYAYTIPYAWVNHNWMNCVSEANGGCQDHPVKRVDVIINTANPKWPIWRWNYPNYQTILTHEFGHAVGLDHHWCSDDTAMRDPLICSGTFDFTELESHDQSDICSMYPHVP